MNTLNEEKVKSLSQTGFTEQNIGFMVPPPSPPIPSAPPPAYHHHYPIIYQPTVYQTNRPNQSQFIESHL
jgi:hypothetical protein